MSCFYFTFDSDPKRPYGPDEYVCVEAENMVTAISLFNIAHPNHDDSQALNCAAVHTAHVFNNVYRKRYVEKGPIETIALLVSHHDLPDGAVIPCSDFVGKTVKVRDILPLEIDIDMYDDVCEELSIAFCGPLKLTPEGEKEFADVLDYDVGIRNDRGCMIGYVHVDDDLAEVWSKRLERAYRFFHAAAGDCSCEDYDRWFLQ